MCRDFLALGSVAVLPLVLNIKLDASEKIGLIYNRLRVFACRRFENSWTRREDGDTQDIQQIVYWGGGSENKQIIGTG